MDRSTLTLALIDKVIKIEICHFKYLIGCLIVSFSETRPPKVKHRVFLGEFRVEAIQRQPVWVMGLKIYILSNLLKT